MRIGLDGIVAMLRPDSDLDCLSFPWASIRYSHTGLIRTKLSEKYAPATANCRLSALRGVLKECWRLGQMSAEDYHKACDIEPVRGSRELAGREVTQAELEKLFSACTDSDMGKRDAAILSILYGCGLRRAELAGLDITSLENGVLRLIGKRNKERSVPLPKWALDRLNVWLNVRGTEPGPLFLPFSRSGPVNRRMIPLSVYTSLKRTGERAGVAHFSPHDMRRTLTSNLLDKSKDPHAVQLILGHSNIATTMRYDRRGERIKVQAINKITDPSKHQN
jgi:site-specific recombinase XerC